MPMQNFIALWQPLLGEINRKKEKYNNNAKYIGHLCSAGIAQGQRRHSAHIDKICNLTQTNTNVFVFDKLHILSNYT